MAGTWIEVIWASGVASLSDNNPVDIGTVASAGSNAAASRDDHVHKPGAGCIDSVALFAADVIVHDAMADDSVGSDQLKPFTGAINFGGQQAVDLVLHKSSAAPSSVVGKVYYDTDDNKVYICTSV